MAARATDRQSEHALADDARDVVELVGERLLRIVGFVVPRTDAQQSGRDRAHRLRAVELVTGKLRAQESVVRHVPLECRNDPVAVTPRIGLFSVALVAVGLRETRQVEPVPRHALAVLGTREQSVDQALPAIGRGVLLERVDLLQSRR